MLALIGPYQAHPFPGCEGYGWCLCRVNTQGDFTMNGI